MSSTKEMSAAEKKAVQLARSSFRYMIFCVFAIIILIIEFIFLFYLAFKDGIIIFGPRPPTPSYWEIALGWILVFVLPVVCTISILMFGSASFITGISAARYRLRVLYWTIPVGLLTSGLFLSIIFYIVIPLATPKPLR